MSYVLKEAAYGLRHAKASVSVVALSLLLLGTFVLITANLYRFIEQIRERVELRVYLSDGADDPTLKGLTSWIEGVEGVHRTQYVDQEEAAAEFRAEFGDSLLDVLSWNPLPRSIRVEMERGHRTSGRLREVAEQIVGEKGVEEIDYGEEWLKRLDRGVWVLIVIDMLLAVVVGMGCVFAASNSVGLTMLARREAIEIMELVGATRGFILRPFLLEGVLQGILGGGLSALGIYAGSKWVAPLLTDLALHWSVQIALALIPLGILLGGIGAATALHTLFEERQGGVGAGGQGGKGSGSLRH